MCILQAFVELGESSPWKCGNLQVTFEREGWLLDEVESLRTTRLVQPRMTFEQHVRVTRLGVQLAAALHLEEISPGDMVAVRRNIAGRTPIEPY